MISNKLLSCLGSNTTYVEDVFSAYTYTGNGSTQTITNGIDLAGKGGLVWIKNRATAGTYHQLCDTVRGATKELYTNRTDAEATQVLTITGFNSNGFSVGSDSDVNQSATGHVSWTFRKAPKFFDVVTFTAGSSTNRRISHSLGQAPGMILLKANESRNWYVYHRSLGRNSGMYLNLTNASFTVANTWGTSDPTDTDFGFDETGWATPGVTQVAYLFAHDTGTDGLIQCGSFTTDGSGNATVNLGWEPQFVLTKNSGASNNWQVFDSARGFPEVTTAAQVLFPNLSNAETGGNTGPTATGFRVTGGGASNTLIYLAIRRPNKPPTVGTQVYNATARTGTGAAATVTGVGFAPDLVIDTQRAKVGDDATYAWDRLRGPLNNIVTNTTVAEANTVASLTAFGMDGINVEGSGRINANTQNYINWFFKRAPGVFDVVCWTGDGTQGARTHGLGVVPELVIQKARSTSGSWAVQYGAQIGYLELTNAFSANTNNLTVTTFKDMLGLTAPGTAVAYLFASKAAISKVGSYTGNGTTNAINCGFTTGARFILIKRTDSTGDWYVWDTARGIIAGNDPHLSLNTTAAEVTTNDSIDPDTSGFIVNQLATTNINVNAAAYIYLAFA